MDPTLAECYVKLKQELDNLLQKKVSLERVSHIRIDVGHASIKDFWMKEWDKSNYPCWELVEKHNAQ